VHGHELFKIDFSCF